MRLLIYFLIIISTVVPAYGANEDDENKNIPYDYEIQARYDLVDDKILSWKEIEKNMVSIDLTKSASEELGHLSVKHLNQRLAFYIEDVYIMAPVVRSKMFSDGIMISTNDVMNKKLLSLLPTKKEVH